MILKNFSQINPGIAFFPGNRLRTMHVLRKVYAEAIIPEEIPFEFGIADLEDFVETCFYVMGRDKAISVYEGKTIQQIKNPEGFYQYFSHEIDKIFSHKEIKGFKNIKEKLKAAYADVLSQEVVDKERIVFLKVPEEVEYKEVANSIVLDKIDTLTRGQESYNTCKATLVFSPGEKRIQLPESEDNTQFILEKEVLGKIKQSKAKPLYFPFLCITETGLLIRYKNPRNEYKITIPGMDYKGGKLIIKLDNLKYPMNLDYDVEINEKGISRFVSRNKKYNLTYFIALESGNNVEEIHSENRCEESEVVEGE